MKNKQKGMALIVSLSLMTMALILGVSGMQTSRVEESAAGSNRAASNALMAAEFGSSAQLEANSSVSLTSLSSCSDPPNYGNSISINNSQDESVSYRYEICSPSDEIVRITTEGSARDVPRIIQVEMLVKSVESTFTDLAAINLAGNVSSFDAPNSNAFVVEGLIDDKFEGGALPAITTNGQQSYIEDQIGTGRIDNYTGGISDEIGNSILSDADKFNAFIEDLKAYAAANNRAFDSISTTGKDKTDLGSSSNPLITHVTGDMALTGNASGAGILLVDGDYGTAGTPYFEGLVIVLGNTFGIAGGGNGGLSGALISAPMQDSLEEGVEKQFSNTDVVTAGGGTAAYSHDPGALSAAFDLLPVGLQDFWKSNNTTTFLPPERSIASWSEINL
ncbi:hypothetical protein ACM26W_17475 [Halomonas sp. HK25]|uniref:pilus assembly PilX family protein n=1 Tax=Halomonas sp. HK25 TaxID=3394321 RepID=UPI0039FD3002